MIHISGKASKESMNKSVDQHMITTSVMLLFSMMRMASMVSCLLLVNLNTTELLNSTTQEQNHGHTKIVSKNMNGFMASQQSISMVLLTCLVVKNLQCNSGLVQRQLESNCLILKINRNHWKLISPGEIHHRIQGSRLGRKEGWKIYFEMRRIKLYIQHKALTLTKDVISLWWQNHSNGKCIRKNWSPTDFITEPFKLDVIFFTLEVRSINKQWVTHINQNVKVMVMIIKKHGNFKQMETLKWRQRNILPENGNIIHIFSMLAKMIFKAIVPFVPIFYSK